MIVCEKCANRADRYLNAALDSLPKAQRTLELLRSRLKQQPAAAVFFAGGSVERDLLECSLTSQDLSRILATGNAIASLRARNQDGYWLSVCGTVEQGNAQRSFVLVAHYTWPPPLEGRWPLVLTRIIEVGQWHSLEGYPLCWCQHTKEAGDELY